MRLRLLAIPYHLIPLIPLFMGLPFASIAAFLLVAVPYIKVQKLTAQLAQCNVEGSVKEKASLERTIRLWRGLTFLKVSAPDGGESQKQLQDKRP